MNKSAIVLILWLASFFCFADNQFYYPEYIDGILGGKFAQNINNKDVKQEIIFYTVIYYGIIEQQCGEFLSYSSRVKAAGDSIKIGLSALAVLGKKDSKEFSEVDSALTTFMTRVKRDIDTYIQISGGCKSRPVYDFEDAIENIYRHSN